MQRPDAMFLILVAGLSLTAPLSHAQVQSCVLSSQHAGVTFPVDRVEPAWACRLQPIISNYTTANKVGPIRTPLPEALYRSLLDRPPMAAALVNRLGLAPYQATMKGPNQFGANDGEGTEGLVQLIYQDRSTRMYYLEGFHVGPFLPRVSGKAVILVRMSPVKESNGADAVDTTLVSYIRLDNRFLSGLLSLLRPLVGGAMTRKLTRAVNVANRLSLEMRQHPERVLQEATAAPALPPDEMIVLKEALATLHNPLASSHQKTATP